MKTSVFSTKQIGEISQFPSGNFTNLGSLCFAVIGFTIAVAGVLATPAGGPSISGLLGVAMYFTIWTNAAAALLFGSFVIVLGSKIGERYVPASTISHYTTLSRFALYLAASLFLVGAAYWILLAPLFAGSLWTFSNLATHLITPILCLCFVLFWLHPGSLRPRDIGFAAILPLIYTATVYIGYALGHTYPIGDGVENRFPYFFMDFHTLGWPVVIAFIIGIAIIVLSVASALYLVDRRRTRATVLKHAIDSQQTY